MGRPSDRASRAGGIASGTGREPTANGPARHLAAPLVGLALGAQSPCFRRHGARAWPNARHLGIALQPGLIRIAHRLSPGILAAPMTRPSPHRSLIALLRGSTRVAGWVLAVFLTTVGASVACADHDLADAGIGQHQSHMPAPDESGSSGSGSSADSNGHCCQSGGCHTPAITSLVAVLPVEAQVCMASAEDHAWPSAGSQRELRPPIL